MTKNARSMYHCRWSFCGEETSWRCRLTTWRMAGSAPVRSCGSANSGWLTWLTRGCTVPACCHSLFSCRKSSSTNTLRCHLQYSLHQHLLLCNGASGCVVESQICNLEVAGSNLGQGYFAPRSTQPSIPPRSVNEYQLWLGRQREVWLIPIADELVGVQVKLWNPLRTQAIPECFCYGDSLQRGAISSVCTFTLSTDIHYTAR